MQAFAAWRWWNFYESRAPEGKTLLRLNLDETSLCVYQGDVKGAVFVSRLRASTLKQHVPRAKRRRNVTLVATVCDNPSIQHLLPQFIIGNATTFKAKEIDTLRGACPSNVVLIRQKSAWNNERLFATIIRRIAASLEPFVNEMQPVLLYDSAPLHLTGAYHTRVSISYAFLVSGRVLRACQSVRIWPLVMPPKLTWRLQPLDTHGFHPFKIAVHQVYQRNRACTRRGEVDTALFLQSVYEAIRLVFEGREWHRAFEHNGFGLRQTLIAHATKAELQLKRAVIIEPGRPSSAELALCFPKNALKAVKLTHKLFIDHAQVDAVSAPTPSSSSKPGLLMHRCRNVPMHYVLLQWSPCYTQMFLERDGDQVETRPCGLHRNAFTANASESKLLCYGW